MRHLGANVIKHHRIKGNEVFLEPPSFTGFSWAIRCHGAVVVCVRVKRIYSSGLAIPGFAVPGLFGRSIRAFFKAHEYRAWRVRVFGV